MSKTIKKCNEYLKEPYSRILIPDEDSGTYTALILEFPGCIAQGDTPQEAYEHLENAAKDWIEAALDFNQEIPSPLQSILFSGKTLLRLPKSLHRQLSLLAEREGVSLNQFIVSALAEKVGALMLYDKLSKNMEQKMLQVFSAVTHSDYVTTGSAAGVSSTIISSTLSKNRFSVFNFNETTEVKANAGDENYRLFPPGSRRGLNKIQ